jgi:hypothetical protein
VSAHLDEEGVVLACFGDEGPGDADHLRGCAQCAAAVERMRALLSTIEAEPVPERGDDYGARVWERLQPALEFDRARRRRRAVVRRSVMWGTLAASLVVAFLAGRQSTTVVPVAAEAIPPEARERILLLAVGEHLERSQVLLVELTNAGPGAELDVEAARETAEDLVTANRVYRASAARAGDAGVASVLAELERVLVSVAHQDPEGSGRELERIRRRIEDRGLLFKVRVIGSQVRERGGEGHGAPIDSPRGSKVRS